MAEFQTSSQSNSTAIISYTPITALEAFTVTYRLSDAGKLYSRSFVGVDMEDAIFNPANAATPNGWYMFIFNADPVANLTLFCEEDGVLINNQTEITIGPFQTLKIISDGTHLFAEEYSSTEPGGNVVGIPPTTDNALSRWDGVNADSLQNSVAILSDAGALSGLTGISLKETGAGTDAITLQAPASIAASYTLTLPVDDGTANQLLQTDGNGVTSWVTVTPGTGDVVGPASATDNAISRFDGITGKLIQNSLVTIGDTGIINTPANEIDFTGAPVLLVNGGSTNVFLGIGAGNKTLSGTVNTGVGANALIAVTTGTANSAFGLSALGGLTTGQQNCAFGRNALAAITDSANNSAFGDLCLSSANSGSFLSGFGSACLSANTSGTNNSAFGVLSMTANTSGSNNSAFGVSALQLSNGDNNTAFGSGALTNSTISNLTTFGS